MERKVIWLDQDKKQYGPFSIQENGFPNAGEVVAFYRKSKNMSRAALAQKLGVTSRRVQVMEHDNEVFESITRRRALAELLDIPLVLFGLVSSSALKPVEEERKTIDILTCTTLDKQTIEQYSEMNRLYWNLYYTGSNTDINQGIQSHIQKLLPALEHAGDLRARAIEQLSNFYELASRIAMDQLNPDGAVGYIDMALQWADPDASEVYGRLLYKKGLALFEAERFHEAQAVLESTQHRMKRLSIPLAGSVLLQLGLIRSYQTDISDHTTSLRLFERSGGLVRDARNFGAEGVRLDEGRYLTAYGEGLTNLGRYADAEDILEKARKKTSPDLTKRLLLIDIQELRLYMAQREYTLALSFADEVREKAEALKSLRTVQTIDKLIKPASREKRRR